MIIILSGPAGAGKDTIWNTFQKTYSDLNIGKIVTTTTRLQRDYEIDGIHYNFVSLERFTQMIKENELIEYAQVHGNYYGSSLNNVRQAFQKYQNIIFIIDVQGFKDIKKSLGSLYKIVSFFVMPPSKEVLIQRLTDRGTENEFTLQKRLQSMEFELAHQDLFDHKLINDDIHIATKSFYEIIKANI